MNCQKIENWDFLFKKCRPEWLQPCCADHQCFLVDFCLLRLANSAKNESCNLHVVHNCTNAMNRLTIVLRDENWCINDATGLQLLHYVLQFIDYALDVVCHLCVNIFQNLLLLHEEQCLCCSSGDKLACTFIQDVSNLLTNPKGLTPFRLRALVSPSYFIMFRLTQYMGHNGKHVITNELFGYLYQKLGNASFSNVISNLITSDLCSVPERHNFHIKCIKECLIHKSTAIRLAIKQRILCNLLKLPQLRTWYMENFFCLLDLPENTAFFLEGKLTLTKFAILHQKTASMSQGWEHFLSLETFLIALLSDNIETKLSSWSLLCEHPKNSRPFSIIELDLAKSFISCNFTEQNPSNRLKIFTALGKMLERMRDSAVRLSKDAKLIEDKTGKEAQTLLIAYKQFLHFLCRLAFFSLAQNSNFNRRLSALTLIRYLFCTNHLASKNIDLRELGNWITNSDVSSIISCLDDEFQLCQDGALEILTSSQFEKISFDFQPFLNETKNFILNGSGNGSVSNYRLRFLCYKFPDVSMEYLQRLFQRCEEVLEAIDQTFLCIAENGTRPYPILASIEHILWANYVNGPTLKRSELETLVIEKFIPICFKFAKIVSPVCHSLSPEGYLPSEVSDCSEDLDMRFLEQLHVNFAQKLLVSCWRTHKCVSFLFSFVVSKFEFPSQLSIDILRQIGDYLWLQLTECRHCGAFESAAQAFDNLCACLWRIEREETGESMLFSPSKWLHQALDALDGEKDIDNLCLTRRSAGLPHLISIILVTAKDDRQFPFLNSTIERLLKCRQLQTKYEIHCVNVLKVLFSNSVLAEGVLMHVEPALNICFSGCASLDWAIRNAYCQLFAVLIHRVFGIPKMAQRTLHVPNQLKMSSFNFFSRYPSLYPVLQERLESSSPNFVEFGKFPILILLSYLHPSTDLEMKFPLSSFFRGVLTLLFTSPIQKLRELAASAFLSIASLFELEQVLKFVIKRVMEDEKKRPPENFLNASLILILAIDELKILNNEAHESILDMMRNLLSKFFSLIGFKVGSDFNRSALLSLICKIGTPGQQIDVSNHFFEFLKVTTEDAMYNKNYLSSRILDDWHCTLRSIGTICAKFQQQFWQNLYSDCDEYNKYPSIYKIKQNIRYEAYRIICVDALELNETLLEKTTDKSKKSASEAILLSALADLSDCVEERHLEFLLKLLIKEAKKVSELVAKHQLLNVQQAIDEAVFRCRRVGNRLNLMFLKFRLFFAGNKYFLGNVRETITDILVESDDENERLIALKFIAELIDASKDEKCISVAAIALKDESGELRNYTAKFITRYILSANIVASVNDIALNAEICWSLALEKFPELAKKIVAADNGDEGNETDCAQLFDVCPQNIFAENFAIFEFDNVKRILEHLRN